MKNKLYNVKEGKERNDYYCCLSFGDEIKPIHYTLRFRHGSTRLDIAKELVVMANLLKEHGRNA